MRPKLLSLSAGILFVIAPPLVLQAKQLTTTLLPAKEEGAIPDKRLWVQNSPKKNIVLEFDLSGLPAGLPETGFKECTLRLVASDVLYKAPGNDANTGGSPVIVTGRVESNATNSVSLTFSTPNPTVSNKVNLRDFYARYKSDKKIRFTLSTVGFKASSAFFSSANFGNSPSNIPRLVVQYTAPAPSLFETMSWPQHQQNPEHTGRNEWKPVKNPNGFTVEKVNLPPVGGRSGAVVDYPLIYQGKMYLIDKSSNTNYLVTLDFRGKPLPGIPEKDIGAGTVKAPPAISGAGILYVLTENTIKGYDLTASAKEAGHYPEAGKLAGSPSNYTDLTVGNDGSVFLAMKESDVDYIYGFTPALKPFLKSGALPKGNVSTVTVSEDGKDIFAETSCPAAYAPVTGCIAKIDVVNPSTVSFTPLKPDTGVEKPEEYSYTPIAGAANVTIFSDYAKDASRGNVWAWKYSPGQIERIWNSPSANSLVSRPVLGFNGNVYFVQGGNLLGHKLDAVGSAAIKMGSGLSTTSNLVMDGADNIYFWNGSKLLGYKADGNALFAEGAGAQSGEITAPPRLPDGPVQFIRLMAGPDGTVWANNSNANFLWAFKPKYTSPDWTLKAGDFVPKDAGPKLYRTSGTLTVGGDVELKAGTNTLFQAGKIVFGIGFKIEAGASLLCRTE